MRVGRVILGSLAALALLLLALLLALGSAPALRALTGLPWQGSLWTGLQLPAAEGEQAGWRWRLEGLRVEPPQRQDGLWRLRLLADSVRLDALPGRPDTPPPTLAALQAQLAGLARLPAVRVEAALARLRLQGQAIDALQLALESRPEGLRLALPGLRVQGAALQAEAQLSPQADLQARLNARRDGLRLALQAAGRLDDLRLQAALQQGEEKQGEPKQAALLDLDARLDALAAQPLRRLQARWQDLDPRRLHAQAPVGRWSGQARWQAAAGEGAAEGAAGGAGEGARLRLELDSENHAARRLDEGGWPLRRLHLRAALDPLHWQALELQSLQLELGNARQGAGRLALAAPQRLPRPGEPLQTRLQLVGLLPQQLDAGWPAWPIDGSLALRSGAQAAAELAQAELHWQLALASPATGWRLEGQGSLQGQRLRVQDALLSDAGTGRLRLQGEAERRPAGWRANAALQAQAFGLRLPPWSAASRLDGQLRARWQQQGGTHEGELDLQLEEGSQLAGLPLTGHARWAPGAGAAPWQLQLQGSGLQLQAEGDAAEAGQPLRRLERLRQPARWLPRQARWQVDELAHLAPLWRPWLAELAGRSTGRWQAEARSLQAELEGLRLQLPDSAAVTLRLQRAALRWQGRAGQLTLQGARQQGLLLKELNADFGLDQALRWQAAGEWRASGAHATDTADSADTVTAWQATGRSAAAGAGEDGVWRWPQLQLTLGPAASAGGAGSAPGEPWLQLDSPELLWDGAQARLAPGSLRLAGETLALQAAQWRRGEWQLALDGRVRLRPWLALAQRRRGLSGAAGEIWQGDASAQLQLRAAQREGEPMPQLELRLGALQGALQLDGQALGLRDLTLQLQQQAAGSASLQARLHSALLGELDADLQIGAGSGGALAGQLALRLPRFASLRPWLPLGLQLEGEAELQARLAGTRAAPQFQGQATARLDSLRHAGSGFAARQGRLQAQFDLDRLQVHELSLLGAGEDGGRLQASGSLAWKQGAPQARLQAHAERLRVLGRFDRRLVLSGDSRLELDGRRLLLNGRLRADEGLFEVGQSDAPALDADVQVLDEGRVAAAEPGLASRWQREVDLQLELGERLRVQGRGFASRLTGALRLSESGGKPWQLHGRIETQGGRYRAYGQNLEIESGELHFSGAPDNPRLDLRAIKPDIEHRVGVSVTGRLEQPRIRLFAEPELSDNDKLAWLLLGRDPGELAARDTALLQRAALALLAGEGESAVGRLMDSLGLTEFSVGQGEDAGTVLRLGARLSRHWSVGYERSLNATSGSWQLIYRLGQRLRVRAQSGTESALDALWLWRFD